MIADLPHDVQYHVWDMYTEELNQRLGGRHYRDANNIIRYICVLCNQDTAVLDYLLDWVAHILQYPDLKPSKAIVLAGREGWGKTMLVHLLARLIPTLYTNDPRHDVYGRQNALMEFTQLVVIEDAERLHLPDLRGIISNQLVTIRGMHPPRNVPSSHRMLIIVKELQASLTCTRTFYPIHCTEECMWDPVTMDGLRRIVTPPAINALRDILLARDVDRDI